MSDAHPPSRHKNWQDITGKDFGRLKILDYQGKRDGRHLWRCQCTCGSILVMIRENIGKVNASACACESKKPIQNAPIGFNQKRKDNPEYISWLSMRARILNPKNKKYPSYGGRGITICERWNSFSNFLSDMGMKPSTEHSIERKENDGNYEPSNCIWATKTTQARNRRSTRSLTMSGETKSAAEWAERYGMSISVLYARLNSGWSHEKAITTPPRKCVRRINAAM